MTNKWGVCKDLGEASSGLSQPVENHKHNNKTSVRGVSNLTKIKTGHHQNTIL
jgi:hypothetical protein